MIRRRALTDPQLAAVALGVLVAAWWAAPVPILPVGVGLALGWWRGGRIVCAAGLMLLASGLGHRAWVDVAPARPRRVGGWYVVRSDPEEVRALTRFEVTGEGPDDRRLEAWVSGRGRAGAAELQAGDAVVLTGTVGPRSEGADWLARRHVVGRLAVDEVGEVRFARGPPAVANRMRRLLGIGSQHLGADERGLLAGFVLGDDRYQSPQLVDTFRASGLSHLLVVSGQNVAFVLLLCRPIVGRLGVRSRGIAIGLVLWFFALATRFEPSVLRATVMAAVATAAWTLGLTLRARRGLALTVIALVLVDPLIAGQLGFLLSVVASGSILLFSGPMADRLRGPRALREALAVSVVAQAAVAPLLAPLDGGFSLATIPANLLAVPVAGPLMAWGLTAGLAGGLAAESGWQGAASVAHLPSRACLWWIQSVAGAAADAPVGRMGPLAAVAVSAVALLALRLPRDAHGAAHRWRVAAAALILALVAPAVPPPAPPPRGSVEVGAARSWATTAPDGRSVQVVRLDGRTTAADVLALTRRVPLTEVVVIVASPSRAAAQALEVLAGRVPVLVAWGPAALVEGPAAGMDPAVLPVAVRSTHTVGSLRVTLTPDGDTVRVEVDEPVLAPARPAGPGPATLRGPSGPSGPVGSPPPATGVASARGPPARRTDHGPACARAAA